MLKLKVLATSRVVVRTYELGTHIFYFFFANMYLHNAKKNVWRLFNQIKQVHNETVSPLIIIHFRICKLKVITWWPCITQPVQWQYNHVQQNTIPHSCTPIILGY